MFTSTIADSFRGYKIDIREAVRSRRSCRAFLKTPVSPTIIQEILSLARMAPSGGNLQPWYVHVLTGASLAGFLAVVEQEAMETSSRSSQYAVYPPNLWEPYRSRRYRCGENLYAALGIPREDAAGRRMHLRRNLTFFDAPVGLFFSLDRRFDAGQWADLGMFMQTIMLLARAYGLDTCAQEFWASWHLTVSRHLAFPPERQLFCGMAMGYADQTASVNNYRESRDPTEDFVAFLEA